MWGAARLVGGVCTSWDYNKKHGHLGCCCCATLVRRAEASSTAGGNWDGRLKRKKTRAKASPMNMISVWDTLGTPFLGSDLQPWCIKRPFTCPGISSCQTGCFGAQVYRCPILLIVAVLVTVFPSLSTVILCTFGHNVDGASNQHANRQ